MLHAGNPCPRARRAPSESCSMPKKMMMRLFAPAMTMPPIVQKTNRAAYEPGLPPSSALRSEESKNVIASVEQQDDIEEPTRIDRWRRHLQALSVVCP